MRISCLALSWLLVMPTQAVAGAQQPANSRPQELALSPGDVVRISIWREPDLSGEFLVDEDGVVTLPLLGKRSVLNVPLSRLRDTLIADYGVQLRNPSVTRQLPAISIACVWRATARSFSTVWLPARRSARSIFVPRTRYSSTEEAGSTATALSPQALFSPPPLSL